MQLIRTLSSVGLAALSLFPLYSASAQNQSDLLKFELTFQNPNTYAVALTTLGIVNDPVLPRNEMCKSFSRIPIPFADYTVRFRVLRKGEYSQAVHPPLVIAPNEIRTITIGVIPDASGLCGYWSTNVKAFSRFTDGTTIFTQIQQLTDKDVKRHTANTPDDDRIIAYLRHPRPELRIEGIDYLVRSTIDSGSKEALLRHKLNDSEYEVQRKAALAAGQLRLSGLAPDIEKIIESRLPASSGYAHLKALVQIRSPSSMELIVQGIDQCATYSECDIFADAIVAAGQRDLIDRIRKDLETILIRDKGSYREAGSFRQFPGYPRLSVLVKAKDPQSISLVGNILANPRYDSVAGFLLSSLAEHVASFQDGYGLMLKSEVDKSEFLTAHKRFYERMFTEPDGGGAEPALLLLVMTGASRDQIRELVRQGLARNDLSLQGTSAHVAAFFRLTDQVPKMVRVSEAWPKGNHPWSFALLCRSLKEMGKECKER
jgi:hypothetical protein